MKGDRAFNIIFDLRLHVQNKRGEFKDTFLLHLSYELHAMVSINKMLVCHARFLLYLLQEIESILSHTTSCTFRFCRIERLYGSFPYSYICPTNFLHTTDKRYGNQALHATLNIGVQHVVLLVSQGLHVFCSLLFTSCKLHISL